MHEETYPDFFTLRDKEPSLSSFEKTSSEFDWLERKITRKQKYIGKTEQVLCRYISYLYKRLLISRLFVAWHVRVSTKFIPKVLTLK